MIVKYGVVLLAACVVHLEPPANARISCETNKDCPANDVCHPLLKECVASGLILAEPEVAFISPHDGESDVSVTPTIVVAFTVGVDPASVATRAHLIAADGTPVRLGLGSASTANTVALSAGSALEAETLFSFTLDAGIAPAPGVNAVSSSKSFTSGFTTGPSPDLTPPGLVSSISISRSNETRMDLSWTNPSDLDFAGVLILRKAGAVVTEVPQNGVTYASHTPIGDATVVAFINDTQFSDVSVLQGIFYDYAFFAFDKSSNYAAAVRVPFVSAFPFAWCASESGTFEIDSPDAGTAQISIGEASFYPPTAVALNTPVPLSLGTFLLDQSYSIRSVAQNANGSAQGLAQIFVASDNTLGSPTTVDPVPIGAPASFVFQPDGWPGFEAQVDIDPLAGSENFVDAGASVVGDSVIAPMTASGTYRLRVRPIVNGCTPQDADWVTSAEFAVGSGKLYYVSTARGSDANNGLTPLLPFATIGHAVNQVVAGDPTDIFVETGTYAEVVTLVDGVRLSGGYAAQFVARDVPFLTSDKPPKDNTPQYPTTIVPTTFMQQGTSTDGGFCPAIFGDAAITDQTLVDGFEIIPPPSLHQAAGWVGTAGVFLAGGSPIIRNNHNEGGLSPNPPSNAVGVYGNDCSTAQVLQNRIDNANSGGAAASDSANGGIGVSFYCNPISPASGVMPNISGNHIVAHIGIEVRSNSYTLTSTQIPTLQPLITGNLIEGDPQSLKGGGAWSIYSLGMLAKVSGNWLFPRHNHLRFGDTGSTEVLHTDANSLTAIWFDGNVMDSGDDAMQSIVDNGDTDSGYFALTNNLISLGTNPPGYSAGGSAVLLFTDAGNGGTHAFFIANNTIYVRAASTATALTEYINSGAATSHTGTVRNNLILGQGGWFFSFEGNARLAAADHNVILSPDAGAWIGGTAACHTTTCSAGTCSSATDLDNFFNSCQGVTASADVSSPLTAADVFVSFVTPGTDLGGGKWATLADSDLHLKTTDTSITKAAATASIPICPYCGCTDPTCAGVSEDFDGIPRFSGNNPVGAYVIH